MMIPNFNKKKIGLGMKCSADPDVWSCDSPVMV